MNVQSQTSIQATNLTSSQSVRSTRGSVVGHGANSVANNSVTNSSVPAANTLTSTFPTNGSLTKSSLATGSLVNRPLANNSATHFADITSETNPSSNMSVQQSMTPESLNPSASQFNMKSGAISVLGLSAGGTQEETDKAINVFNQDVKLSKNIDENNLVGKPVSGFEGIGNKETEAQNAEVDDNAENSAENEAENKAQTEQKQEAVKQEVEQQVQLDAQVIKELSARDSEVKTHEQAHAAVGGSFAHTPQYTYEKGPDGKRYAVEGKVNIDVGVIEGNAQATYNKMQKVYAAAMAPVQPSIADIQVANEAVQKMNEAKKELTAERQEKIISSEDSKQINDLAQHLELFGQQDFTPTYPFDQTNYQNSDTETTINNANINVSDLQSEQAYTPINIAV
ncbi:putative metalloprotease CJM1_0395 family protein [Shewanella goraebulensis]|uniref:putative metalloprotease CJM1_0395 family protein n=1 Tax=Shewanella goraebulensis TaxID=3050637 RepID=UPI00254A59FB|nr:putative metalloprotease CJM1_0395 family protein [Shewanella goraebulensis]